MLAKAYSPKFFCLEVHWKDHIYSFPANKVQFQAPFWSFVNYIFYGYKWESQARALAKGRLQSPWPVPSRRWHKTAQKGRQATASPGAKGQRPKLHYSCIQGAHPLRGTALWQGASAGLPEGSPWTQQGSGCPQPASLPLQVGTPGSECHSACMGGCPGH